MPGLRAAAVVVIGATLAACAGPVYFDRRESTPGAAARALNPVVFEVGPELRRTPPGCIAVLPFGTVAETDAPGDHAERVRRALYAQLAPLAPRDVELAQIDATIATLSLAERRDPARVGRELGCDALLIGTVTDYRQRYLGLYSEVVAGAQLELIRAADGELLWEARHVATSRGGGLPVSIVGVIAGVVRAATNLAGEQLDRITDDLARRLVSALPKLPPEPAPSLAGAGAGAGHAERFYRAASQAPS